MKRITVTEVGPDIRTKRFEVFGNVVKDVLGWLEFSADLNEFVFKPSDYRLGIHSLEEIRSSILEKNKLL